MPCLLNDTTKEDIESILWTVIKMPAKYYLLILLTLIPFGTCENDQEEYCDIKSCPGADLAKKCVLFDKNDFHSDSPSFFSTEPNGRLGNHIIAYAHLYYFQKEFGEIFLWQI